MRPNEAFYVTSLTAPASRVTVSMPVPVRGGDRIRLLGWRGGPLAWSRDAGGRLVIEVPAAARDSGSYAWVFRIGR